MLDDVKVCRQLHFNHKKNVEQDHTALIDQAAQGFCYDECRERFWNPEQYSLLYGTPLWDQSSPSQKLILNHLYWVAYYSQIISAEIATIYFNQIAAAGMFSIEDFRLVCDTLDLESRQERAHIQAFKHISESIEWQLFGERLFTYPMRGPFAETMVFADTNRAYAYWRKLQLQAFAGLSSNSAFLASQYLLIRGLRTLNGKLVQHQLAKFYMQDETPDNAPIPSKISYYHFMDESHHFNTSRIIAHEIPRSLSPPNEFEKWVVNRGVNGCQQDHFHFSTAINGIFWYDPALFPVIRKLLRSEIFGLDAREARHFLKLCFTEESEGLHASFQTHRTAVASYKVFVQPISFLSKANRNMGIMARNSIASYLDRNRSALTHGIS